MHDDIKAFHLEGDVAETSIVPARETMLRTLEEMMRDEQYIPVLDIDPQFTLSYSVETESFRFKMTVYGVKIGDNSWELEGMMNGRTIPKPTRKDRLRPS